MLKKYYHYIVNFFNYIYYGRPSRRLIVVGVTGTKGKSTTCSFIASVLEAGGHKTCLMSTVEFRIGDRRELNTKKMTMLGRGQIHRFLRQAVKEKCEYAVIETSSEGIMQYRHKFLNYDIAVFTNLGTEHQERHGGFENLKRAKGELFVELSRHTKFIDGQKIKKVAVVNGDDENAEYFLGFEADQKFIFGIKNDELRIKNQIPNPNVKTLHATGYMLHENGGIEFQINNEHYQLNLPGQFNLPNSLAAIAVGRSQNIPEEKIKQGIEGVKLVEGRMEFIDEGQPFKVVVDYAHEPLSYRALFESLRSMLRNGEQGTGNKEQRRLLALIGSDGGGRDIGKREKMGKIAGELCDIVIITDVNCFDEDPKAIAEMLAGGARAAGKKDGENLFIEVDRRQAIELAFKIAKAGDVVAITAKGTEPVMCVAGGKKIPWDDRAEARRALGRRAR